MASRPPNIVRRVTETELRRMFNEGRYAEKVERGELTLKVVKSHPTTWIEIQNYTQGTESQEVYIYDLKGCLLVKGHRFLRPDGRLAASGLIDPKRIFEGGMWFAMITRE